MQKVLFLLFIIVTAQGCAVKRPSDYTGPRPNLMLEKEQAQNEYDKFKLKEYSRSQWDGVVVEKSGEWYTISSLKPVFKEVSPKASEFLEDGLRWRKIQWVSLWTCIGFAGVNLISSDSDTKNALLKMVYATCGFSIGAGYVANSKLVNSTNEFNQDLKNNSHPRYARADSKSKLNLI